MSEYRFLAEDSNKRFYLRDGTVTAVALEINAIQVVIPVAIAGEHERELAVRLRDDLIDVAESVGFEVADLEKYGIDHEKSKPMVRYEFGSNTAARELVCIMTVSVAVWPKP